MNCPHFEVKFNAYTYNCSNPLSSKTDTVRFGLFGTCLQCGVVALTTAYSEATSCSTLDHKGSLECYSCHGRVGLCVMHCAHRLLKGLGHGAIAAPGGAVFGAAAGGLLASTVSVGTVACLSAAFFHMFVPLHKG